MWFSAANTGSNRAAGDSQRGRGPRRRGPRRLRFEALEDRRVLSATLAGFDAHTLPRTDDSDSEQASLGFAINFFGSRHEQLFVNNNGNVTFDKAQDTYTPYALTTDIGTAILAPFFADVDTSPSGGGVVSYGTGTVDGHLAFGVTYSLVGYFSSQVDRLNTFQVLIIDRPDRQSDPQLGDDFDIEFNYDQVQWDTGDLSRGHPAVAGFSNGTGQPNSYLEINGSGVADAFLDSTLATGLIHNQINSDVLGRMSSRSTTARFFR